MIEYSRRAHVCLVINSYDVLKLLLIKILCGVCWSLCSKCGLGLGLLGCVSFAWRYLHDTAGVGFVVDVVLIHGIVMGVKLFDSGPILDRRTLIFTRLLIVAPAVIDSYLL